VEKDRLRVDASLLVRVDVFAALVCPTATLPKESAAGLRESGRLPVPASATVCGESGALSLMASEPVSAPLTNGVTVTFTVHEAPAPRLDPQLLLAIAKFPVAATELMVTELVPLFLNVTAFDELVVFNTCGLNARLDGVGVTVGLFATVNGKAANAAHEAPVGKFSTHTWKAPVFAICAAVTVTLSWVELMNLTVGNAPATETTLVEVNPVPLRVNVNADPPGRAAAGLKLAKESGVVVVL